MRDNAQKYYAKYLSKFISVAARPSPTWCVAAFIAAVIIATFGLTWTPARAETCEDAGEAPTPTEVAVTSVPIVVDSTSADYFVLYASHDVDNDVVEYPVRVVRGEDGKTTLSENVAALPKESYRVEKYAIANPADVDGDCIDDITELGDPTGLNPVNPTGAAIPITTGAAAIPDRAAFEQLATEFRGIWTAKFVITDIDAADPTLYFSNVGNRPAHVHVLKDLGVTWETDGLIRGNISNTADVYEFGILPGREQRDALDDLGLVERVYTLLAASMPLIDDDLAYRVRNDWLSEIQSNLDSYRASRINLAFSGHPFSGASFVPLNPGEGYGLLRVMGPDDRPGPRDIVIYGSLPNDLPRVAGILSTVPQTTLSHVNLRAAQDNIPNAYIRHATSDSTITPLVGRYVYYKVTDETWQMRAATFGEVLSHFYGTRPTKIQRLRLTLTETSIQPLKDLGFNSSDAYGVKASNLAVLGHMGFPDGTVPEGFAIPFHFYVEFMKQPLGEETVFGKKSAPDEEKLTLPADAKLMEAVEAILAHPKFRTDLDIQEEMLDDLRDAIEDAKSPQWIIDALTAMHDTYPEGQSLRYRSSTNNEDLPGFNGAGLYESFTQKPKETKEDGIDKSLKQVYASLWNYRAFTERDFNRVVHRTVAMGVLVHPNFKNELVNGVAVSTDPSYGYLDSYYINSQIGEDLVTNPEADSLPEEVLYHDDGTYTVVATSNLQPAGELLMTAAQLSQLRSHLEEIHTHFASLYNPPSDDPFAMEIEFKITSANVLAIKQARPWIFSRPPDAIEIIQGANALTATAEDPPSTHDGTEFQVRVRFSIGIANSFTAFSNGAAQVTGATLTGATRIMRDPAHWEFTLQPDSDGDVTFVLPLNRPCSLRAAVCTVDGVPLTNRLEVIVSGGDSGTTSGESAEAVPARPRQPNITALWPGMVDMKWNDVPAAETYEVQIQMNDQWVHLPADGIPMAFYGPGAVIKNLPPQKYLIRVRAANPYGASEWSEANNIIPNQSPEFWRNATEPTNSAATGTLTINGTVLLGHTLTANVSGISDENGLNRVQFHYQWIRSDGTTETPIEGATEPTYTLTSADVGMHISVRVPFVDRHGFSESMRSAPVIPVTQATNSPTVGEPTVRGTPYVYDRLIVDVADISDENGLDRTSFQYQWTKSDGTSHADIEQANQTSYTLTPADVDAYVAVEVSFVDRHGFSESVRSSPVGPVTFIVNSPATGEPTIDGILQVPQTLTADVSGILDENGLDQASFQYQWTRSDGTTETDIEGASQASYTLTKHDAGMYTGVRVSFTDGRGFSESVNSEPLERRVHSNVPAKGKPTISGPEKIGATLSTDTSSISDHNGMDGVSFSYQWLSNDGTTDAAIDGATNSSYTLVAADFGKTIRVRVSFTDNGGHQETLYSTPVLGPPPTPDPPTGRALWSRIISLEWNVVPRADTYDVQFFQVDHWANLPANDVDVAFYGAGAVIRDLPTSGVYYFRVRAVNAYGASEWSDYVGMSSTDGPAAWTHVAEPTNHTATGAPSINGATQQGSELMADISAISDQNGLDRVKFHYQWAKSDGAGYADIEGTNQASYTLKADDVGVHIRVQVSFVDRHGFPETLTSTPVGPVASGGNSPATGAPAINGVVQVGEALSADTSGIADPDGLDDVVFAYQWISNDGGTDADVDGATNSTYTIATADEGKSIRVRVSFTDDADNEEVLTSEATAAVSPPAEETVWQSQLTAGRIDTIPVFSGFSTLGNSGGTLSTNTFVVNGTTHTVQLLAHARDSLWLGVIPQLPSDFTLNIGDSDYLGRESLIPETGSDPGSYWWPLAAPDWHGSDPVDLSLTVRPKVPLGTRQKAPVTGDLRNHPAEHNGSANFSFDIRFSEGVDTTAEALRDHVLAVSNGSVHSVQALGTDGKRWQVSISPQPDSTVLVEIEPDLDCALEAAVCTADGRRLFNRLALSVPPTDNSPASGAPAISGTPRVDETLTADPSGISDDDGLTSATFNYQWLRNDGTSDTHVENATNSTYTLTDADQGMTVKVRVSFTDDDGNEENCTSVATAPVAARPATPLAGFTLVDTTDQSVVSVLSDGDTVTLDDPANGSYGLRVELSTNAEVGSVRLELSGAKTVSKTENIAPYSLYGDDESGLHGEELPTGSYTLRATAYSERKLVGDQLQKLEVSFTVVQSNSPATGAPTISGTVQVGETLTADTSGIADANGLDNVVYSHQWLVDDGAIAGATGASHILTASEEGTAVKVQVSFTDDSGNDESLTSAATPAVAAAPAQNNAATGAPTISGTVKVGHVLTADTSGIADQDGLNNPTFTYQWLADDTDIIGATASAYLLKAGDKDKTITVAVSFTDDQDNDETVTSSATAAVTTDPLTVSIENELASHDGQADFTFELRFSEEFELSYVTLRDDAFTVTLGSLQNARRLDRDGMTRNIHWEISVRPDGDDDVTITLPATTDCNASGAICTADNRMLSGPTELTVDGPS